MKILIWLLLFAALDCRGMYWAKGGRKTVKKPSNAKVTQKEKTATEKLQKFLKSPGDSSLWQRYGYENNRHNYFLIIEKLIEEGASPNIKGDGGDSLLINMIVKFLVWLPNPRLQDVIFQEKIIKTLLEHGADVNAVSKYGHTPLYIAARDNLPHMARVLLEYGADVNVRNGRENRTALEEARRSNYTEVIRVIESHAKKNKIP